MRLPPADIHVLADTLRDAVADVMEAYEADAPSTAGEGAPDLLAEAFGQLIEVFKRIDADQSAETESDGGAVPNDVTQLGDYGLGLLDELAAWAARLGLEGRRQELEVLALPLALWLARRGGELRSLESVVNAAAAVANHTHEPRELEDLYAATGEVMEAATLTIRQDLERDDPGRPWRILNLNRAIVAARTHNPRVMEEAFETLVENLPEDAPAFFREGMGRMGSPNHPPRVREVMERYYRKWCLQHPLH
jgi:hypothetical protein